MRAFVFTLSILLLMNLFPDELAAVTATQTVTQTLSAINSISVSGNPGTMTVSTALAGSPPTSASDSSTTYNLTSNQSSQRITATLSSAMPAGVTLSASLAAPTGATSAGSVSLTTSSQALVTGITKLAQSNLTITYTLAAAVTAAPQGPLTRTITYTLGP